MANYFYTIDNIAGLQTSLNAKQPLDSDLTTIAALTPTTGQALIYGASAWESRTLTASDIPSLDASKVSTGTFAAARIPNLDASKVTTGSFTSSQIPNLDASKITTGTFNAARIPDLSTVYQPLDSDLTAIAALSTQSYGRSLLTTSSNTAARLSLYGLDVQISGTKPTTRSDSSALQTGDRWLDTTDRLWWFWNGTYWLSEQVFPVSTNASITSGTTNVNISYVTPGYNLFLVDWVAGGLFNPTQNASNFWGFVIQRVSTGTAGTVTNVSSSLSFNDITLTSGINITSKTASLNLFQDVTSLQAAYYRYTATPTGTPGAVGFTGLFRYRLAKP